MSQDPVPEKAPLRHADIRATLVREPAAGLFPVGGRCLAAGIWTRDLAQAHRVAARLEAGQVYINESMSGGVETPLGG